MMRNNANRNQAGRARRTAGPGLRPAAPQGRWLFLLLAAVTAFAPAHAGTYTAEASQESYSFFGVTSRILFGLNSPPGFTADFSSDHELRVTYTAPAGYRFEATPPSGISTVALVLSFVGLQNFTQGGTVEFPGMTGALPSFKAGGFAELNGGFTVFAVAGLTGPVSFTAMSFTVPIPATYNASFSDLPLREDSYLLFQDLASSPDPGQWAFLVPDTTAVPEPGPGALLLCGLALIGARHCLRSRT